MSEERVQVMAKERSIRILKKPDVTELAGEKVMIDFETGKYFMLVGTANDIWDLLKEGQKVERIVAALMAQYDVTEEICRAGVLHFLEELVRIGFIALV